MAALGGGVGRAHRVRRLVHNAGLDPDSHVSDVALASLAELHIDRSDQTPTKLTNELIAQADVVIALKPGLEIASLKGVRYETWPLPDPADWDIDGIRPLRGHLDGKVQHLTSELTPKPQAEGTMDT